MGRTPCCAKVGLNRGAWTALEDKILADYIQVHGEGKWKQLPKNAGLKRCGKSCRLRWLNYLRPDIKRGNISEDEEELIVRLHKLLGNRWSLIAGRIPGRTDNEIKNYWNTNLSKKTASSSSLSPATMTRNPKKNPSTKNTMPMTGETDSKVFRTRATRCSKVIIQPELPLPPPPPPRPSHDHMETFAADSLFSDLPMIPNFSNLLEEDDDDDDIDNLSLGDFCLADFLNNDDAFDENQISTTINTDNEKDHVFSESDGHEYRYQMMRQSSTNVGIDMNSEHDRLCPLFIADSYDNNWDI